MAAYATEAYAIQMYGADYVTLAFDRDGDGVSDAGVADLWLDIATDEINARLAGKVALPVTTVPRILKVRCVDIAIYRASPSASELTEEKKARYKAAMDWLEAIADNKVKLTDDNGVPLAAHLTQRVTLVTGQDAYAQQASGVRYFSREVRKRDGLL